MNRIERYLGGVIVAHTFLVLFILVVIMGFFEFISQLNRLSESYSFTDISLFTSLKLPMYFYELFPVALLIGMLMGLGRLASGSELTVIRVSGWSVGRIFYSVLKTTLILWVLMTAVGEWVAPASEAYAKKFRGEILQKGISIGDANGFWLKEPDRYIHVERVITTTELRGVTVYIKEDGELRRLITAPKAQHHDGEWTLYNSTEQLLTFTDNIIPQPVRQSVEEDEVDQSKMVSEMSWKQKNSVEQSFQFPLQPDVIESLNIDTRFMSVNDLYHYISFLKENDLEAVNYQLAFWRKIANPLVVLGMVAIVFPLIFGLQRQTNTGQRIFIGVLIGMGFHLFNQIFGNVSILYGFPPVVGAFLPALFMLAIASIALRKL